MKKFFIKKTHSDLVQEQNRLLENLLAKQDDKPKETAQVQLPLDDVPAMPETAEDFYDYDDDVPYFPKTPESSAKLLSVNTNKGIFDAEGVEKLKKTKANTGEMD